jgi:hypothetical protein
MADGLPLPLPAPVPGLAFSDQLVFEADELLETHPIAVPLVAGGMRCHGGFDADGSYVSPRTKKRTPAIRAWQLQHEKTFGRPILEIPLDAWPAHYPSVPQTRFLLREGVTRPIVSALTRVGTVEGFGANIGRMAIADLQPHFREDLTGTATSHLSRGLYEAHGRDEAGFENEGGHRQMWFAARDIAFEDPPTENEIARMLQIMGIGGGAGYGGPGASPAAALAQMQADRQFPADVEFALEAQIARMVRLLFIELAAYRTFAWAEEVLSDTSLVAGDGEAARLVSFIRADERPHVEYLRTVLSEIRDRTLVGASGARHPARPLIEGLWERALAQSLRMNRSESRAMQLRTIESALEDHPRRARILEEFHALGSVRPAPDGTWIDNPLAQGGIA